jgi:hypothetical protein
MSNHTILGLIILVIFGGAILWALWPIVGGTGVGP